MSASRPFGDPDACPTCHGTGTQSVDGELTAGGRLPPRLIFCSACGGDGLSTVGRIRQRDPEGVSRYEKDARRRRLAGRKVIL